MRNFLIACCVLAITFGSAQKRDRLDSLLRTTNQLKEDSNTVKSFLAIGANYRKINPDSATHYIDRAIKMAHRLKYEMLYLRSYYDKIIHFKAFVSPKVYIDTVGRLIDDPVFLNNKRYLQTLYHEIGIAYRKTSNYDKSIKHLQQSLTLAEELKDKKKLYNAYNSLANTYSQMGLSKKSVDDLRKSLTWYAKASSYIDPGKPEVTAMIINNQGVTNYYIGQLSRDSVALSEAIRFYMKSLAMRIQVNDSSAIADSYDNLGSAYHDLCEVHKRYEYLDVAKAYYERAILVDELFNRKVTYYRKSNYGGHISLMGKIRNDKQLIHKGITYLKESLYESDKIQDLFTSALVTLNIASSYYNVQMYDSASNYYIKHIALKDSLLSAENKQVAEELAAKYESDLKDSENKNLKQQADLREEVISRKSNTIKIMIAASVIMLVLIVMVFISRQKITKSRELIKKQKQETEEQKLLIEEKQKEILDSISYSKRLQDAAIPSIDYFKSLLPQSFIYYKPKDIVAGDFYWVHGVQSSAGNNLNHQTSSAQLVLVAAADCTGHGVPGALVSIVCLNALNRCIDEFNLSEPSKILDKAAEIIQQSFRQSENDVKDGMDIALCLLDPGNKKGYFSGANNPVWILSGNNVKEIKGDNQPVGQQHIPKPFTQHEFELHEGDTILLSTDGYTDQFGGPHGKKLKTKNFKEIFSELNSKSIDDVHRKIETFFLDWKGTHEQVDDVLVIGIRI